ncbi:sulfotransferase family protein [Actinomadura rubrisoli]|uniref:Sulfotransferase n=1 Tax=Actinomadura rubrisoli TaxID=2530368 RepID=A0A4R5CD58_9ACTN|nr:sulfotransferase [Actinomadura rubrisoli]TDD96786.1 sulfotransferase [Actinomadura rubrisoli]
MADPFVLIVGAERSGTTVLRGMLDCHSELAVLYESHVVTELDAAFVRRDDGTLNVDAFAKAFIEHRWFKRWELSENEVVTGLRAADPIFYADAIRSLFALYARLRGKRLYGDKSPSYIFRMTHIAERFPEARFVHLVRDGRDAARSLQQAPWGPDDFAGAVRYWRDWLEAGLRAGHRLGPQRYMESRYERLVAEPEETLSEICEFLGLNYESRMLGFHRRADEVLRHERPRYHEHLAEPLRGDIRDWRRDLDDGDLRTFERLAGEVNRSLGYQGGVGR